MRGRVVEVLRDDTKPDQLDPARSMGTQELRILLLEGANKGTEVTIANYLTRTQNVRLRQGETAIICEDLPDSADAYYTVYNYDRAPVLVLILAVFAAAVVAIGGWKGVRTLLGLGFTGAMIAWLILPGIYHGLPSLPLTVAALAVCTLVSLLLLNPPSPKTWAAMLSTLAGVALAAVLEGLTSGIALLNPDVYDQLRFWQAGSLDIRNLHTLKVVLIPVLIAGATALLLSRALNSLSLGSDTATALGSRVARTQLIGLLAITVLCGSATAVVGPIAFIGLMMPHMARWLVGADHRWSLPVTLLATPALLLFADIIGRVIVPGELRVSVVSAFIGAPVLIFLVRRKTRGGA